MDLDRADRVGPLLLPRGRDFIAEKDLLGLRFEDADVDEPVAGRGDEMVRASVLDMVGERGTR